MTIMKVEPATTDDIPVMCALLVELFSMETDFRCDEAKHARGLRMIMERPDSGVLLLLKLEQKVIGMANLIFLVSTAEGAPVVLLEDFIVVAEHRSEGRGRYFMEYIQDYVRKNGFTRLTLLVDRENQTGKAFYKAMDFEPSAMDCLRWFPMPR